MTRFPGILLLVPVLLLSAGAVLANVSPGTGMYGSKHDFSGNGYMVPISGLQVGLCSICHTPHSAISTKLLWNQKLTTATFSWGDTAETSGGTVLPSSARQGPSTKCLSCHDGSVAVGDTAAFYGMIGGKWAPGDTVGWGTLAGRLSGGGVYGVGPVTNGVSNMTGNHPIAVPYPLNAAPGTYNNVTTGARVKLDSYVANPNAPAHGIKLYSDDGNNKINPGTVPGKSGIECTSCHDPHNKSTVDFPLLRGKNIGSSKADGYLCLQCHIK